MGWHFLTDFAFFGLLGILIFVPIVALVASIGQHDFSRAREMVKKFLDAWAAVSGKNFTEKVLKIAGVSTVVVILALSAYVFNRLGDAAMPKLAKSTTYYGEKFLEWSINEKADWRQVKANLRSVTGIEGDRTKWEEAKTAAGAYDARFFRTIFWFFVLLLVAGAIDFFRRGKYRMRGAALGLTAIAGLVLSQWLWSEREGNYVGNMLWRYQSAYCASKEKITPLPKSLRVDWKCVEPLTESGKA